MATNSIDTTTVTPTTTTPPLGFWADVRLWFKQALYVGCALAGICVTVAIISIAVLVYAWATEGPAADPAPHGYERRVTMPDCAQWHQRTYPITNRRGDIIRYECR